MTTALTFTPPTGDLFAAVEVHASTDGESWRVVGASPAFRLSDDRPPRMLPAGSVSVDCKLEPGDALVRLAWVHEDSSRGLEWVAPHAPNEKPRRRR